MVACRVWQVSKVMSVVGKPGFERKCDVLGREVQAYSSSKRMFYSHKMTFWVD